SLNRPRRMPCDETSPTGCLAHTTGPGPFVAERASPFAVGAVTAGAPARPASARNRGSGCASNPWLMTLERGKGDPKVFRLLLFFDFLPVDLDPYGPRRLFCLLRLGGIDHHLRSCSLPGPNGLEQLRLVVVFACQDLGEFRAIFVRRFRILQPPLLVL